MLVHQCLSIPLFQSPDSRTRGDDTGRYSRLELAAAWRVENHDLYCAYKVAQRKVLSFAAKVAVKGDTKVRIRNELYGSASKLPGDLETGCNEVRLLHGTQPGSFLCLLPFFQFPISTSPVLSFSQSPVLSWIQASLSADMPLLTRICVSVYWNGGGRFGLADRAAGNERTFCWSVSRYSFRRRVIFCRRCRQG